MFSELFGLIRLWLITKAMANPLIWVCILIVFTLLLLFSAIFIKFKNGLISKISFLLLMGVGCVAVASLVKTNVLEDDLYLKQGETIAVSDVSSSGLVTTKRRFRYSDTPLLGVSLPDDESVYFNSAKKLILDARVEGTLSIHYSKVYPGVVVYDNKFSSINESLLSQGLARATITSPKQYRYLQQQAVKKRKGMWSVSTTVADKYPRILGCSVIWLTLVITLCLSIVLSPWLSAILPEKTPKSLGPIPTDRKFRRNK